MPAITRFELSSNNGTTNFTKVFDTAIRYLEVFTELFGTFPGEIPPEPTDPAVIARLQGSFYDFLENEGLELLAPTFDLMCSVPGYG